jgi:exodeoxyribonuclease X
MIRCIDLECTGTDPEKDSIVEIASVDLTKDGITNEMETFVDPGCKIPPSSMAVHHIMDEDVKGAPKTTEAIKRFAGADIYLAHNAAFEKSFLEPYFPDAKWICTYKCALWAWPDLTSHTNQALRYELGLANPFGRDRHSLSAHRALSDVIVTAAIFHVLAKQVSWQDILHWSSLPTPLKRFRFGKHKGAKLEEVPDDYLSWICSKSDFEEDVKFWCRHELARRAA